ncbi:MAG: phospholipase D-like domain-containing protein [Verrucomicrobiota bacterium]|nr:phospholipase D-like domain-containing protein [Verrucomicrobiota bacterium]
MLDPDDVVKRLDRRDGFSVADYREVGLPVFRLSCALTVQEATGLGAIEEYLLRAISTGIDSVDSLVRFLGLPARLIVTELGRLVYESAILERPAEPTTYAILPDGSKRLASAATASLVRKRIPLYVDGITRRLVAADPQDLWTSKQLDGQSMLAPVPRRAPKAADIDLLQANKVLSLMAKFDLPASRVVRLDGVIGKPSLLFRRALAIAFKSRDGRRMSLGFAIDGRQSEEHEIEYERCAAGAKSSLFGQLFDADKRRREIQQVGREFKKDVNDESGRRPLLSLQKEGAIPVPASKVRILSVYEHPPLLRSALKNAKTRILLVSPWIRANVVDSRFMMALTECLNRGVAVTIGYGIGKRDHAEREADRVARESLEALRTAFPNFRLVRKGNTHAKVLLVDSEYFVTTSFNWLSFRGDPNQPMREEEGTLVEDPTAVDGYFERMMGRMITGP